MVASIDPPENGELVALVVDDHELFRAGIAGLLMRDCGFTRVFEAGSLDAALEILGENDGISFSSFDLAMPGVDGPYFLQRIRKMFPKVRIAVVSGSGGRDEIILALQAGVHGYVPKTLGISEIAQAFKVILSGGIFVPPLLSEVAGDHHSPAPVRTMRPSDAGTPLTPRQQAVLKLIRSGKSNKEIARELSLTENTVKVHINALYRALGVHNRYGAANAINLV
jgi:DNA-binding NarL/FixJ family response regulator